MAANKWFSWSRLGFRLTVFITVFSLLSGAALTTAGYRIYQQNLKKKYINNGQSIAASVADVMDGDVAEYYCTVPIRDERYEHFNEMIKAIKHNHNVVYLYVVHFDEDGVKFIFDADDAEDFPVPGARETWYDAFEEDITEEQKQEFFDGKEIPVRINSTEEYGTTFMILKPLAGKNGVIKKGYYAGCEYFVSQLATEQLEYFGILFLIAAIITAGFAFVQWLIVNRSVVRPLSTIADTFQLASSMALPAEVNLKIGANSVEFERITTAFNTLRTRLNEYIDTLGVAIAEKERIGAELDMARKIQQQMMPFIFPPFPDRKEFDLYAEMNPAKKVGGDFFDFFFIDRDRLAIVIADVSGKGIAAAMFMVITKTLIKTQLRTGTSIAESAEIVNWQLCQNNETNMFATAWLGIYDTRTGRIDYINAGHNPPLVKSGGAPFSLIESDDPDIVLGVFSDYVYTQRQLELKPNDMLLLYTDGVTEACSDNSLMYGEERLLSVVNRPDFLQNFELKTLIDGIKSDITSFADGAEQYDDMTMLALRRRGYDNDSKEVDSTTITLPASLSAFPEMIAFIDALLASLKCDKNTQAEIDTCAEELFVNIANYAYQGGAGELVISTKVDKIDDSAVMLCITFKDQGVAFNPLESEAPDLELPLEDRKPGGLGVFLVKQMMDTIKYERIDDWNIITVGKKINAILT